MRLSIHTVIPAIALVAAIAAWGYNIYVNQYDIPSYKVENTKTKFDKKDICDSYFNWENAHEQISEGMRNYCK